MDESELLLPLPLPLLVVEVIVVCVVDKAVLAESEVPVPSGCASAWADKSERNATGKERE